MCNELSSLHLIHVLIVQKPRDIRRLAMNKALLYCLKLTSDRPDLVRHWTAYNILGDPSQSPYPSS